MTGESMGKAVRTHRLKALFTLLGAIALMAVMLVPQAEADSGESAPMVRDLGALISVGHKHGCAIEDGQVWCFGDGDWGQLGGALSTGTPVAIPGVTTATAIAAGDTHNCALLASGQVTCWGRNFWGQLGNGSGTPPGLSANSTPTIVAGLTNVVSLAAGQHNTCAVRTNGRVWCWGYNGEGQLGQGSGNTTPSVAPVQVGGITNAVEVSMSWAHACALLGDGGIECWGEGSEGRLGNGGTSDAFTPVSVSGISDAVAVSAGLQFTCAIVSSGQAKCWGDNFYTQLGNGMGTDETTPDNVVNMANAVSISAGEQHACAVRTGGEVWCWGRNARGALGAPGVPGLGSPVPLHSIADGVGTAAAVTANDDHSCVVTWSMYFYCWGQNDYGELGNGSDGNFGSASENTAQRVINVTPNVFCDGELVTLDLGRSGGYGIGGDHVDDVILGTSGADTITSAGGDDLVCAGGGPDVVRSGAGDDTVYGEGGGDDLAGGGGADMIDGGSQGDTIKGQGGQDILYGGAGVDTIDGQGAADEIYGGDDADTINGQNGADVVEGGSGDDVIKTQTGPDTIRGDAGDDVFTAGNGNDTMYGGPGFDKCSGNLGSGDSAEAATCEQTPSVEVLF